jgi:hypothetical protein
MFWKRITIVFLIITLSFTGMAPVIGSALTPDNEGVDVASITFFGEAARLLQDTEDEDASFVSSIILTFDCDTMVVDGEKIPALSPQIYNGDELLPIADIAEALGADVDIDDVTGKISIMDDGEVTVLDTPLFSEDFQLYGIQEVADILTLDYTVEGEHIILTRPFQSKMLLVRMNPGEKLSGTYGAADYISDGNGRYVLKYDTISQAKEN